MAWVARTEDLCLWIWALVLWPWLPSALAHRDLHSLLPPFWVTLRGHQPGFHLCFVFVPSPGLPTARCPLSRIPPCLAYPSLPEWGLRLSSPAGLLIAATQGVASVTLPSVRTACLSFPRGKHAILFTFVNVFWFASSFTESHAFLQLFLKF